MISLTLGGEGLLCAPVDPRFFADASEVPSSNKAIATAICADLVMFAAPTTGIKRRAMGSLYYYQAENAPRKSNLPKSPREKRSGNHWSGNLAALVQGKIAMTLMLLMVVEIGVAMAIGFILGRIWQIRSDLEQQHAGDFRAPPIARIPRR